MDLSALTPALEHALYTKVEALAKEYSRSKLRRLDIGVFPWHGKIELSLLFDDDECNEQDIADWPHYDISKMDDGKWPEVTTCCKEIQRLWELDVSLSPAFFQLVANALKSEKVESAIRNMAKSENFAVTLFDPDQYDSKNYLA